MAKKTIASEIAEALASGKVTKVENNQFLNADGKALQVRSMESTNDPLQVGDEVTIPADYQVLSADINGNPASFIFAEVKEPNGAERNMRLYPNSFAKVAFAIDPETKNFIGKYKTTGSVAEWYAKFTDVNEAFKEAAGKTFVVAKKDTYLMHNRFTEKDEKRSIFEYNWKQ